MNAKLDLAKDSYPDVLTNIPLGAAAWLNNLHSEAAQHASTLGFPTTSDEDWRFTDLTPLRKYAFQPATPSVSDLGLSDIGSFIIPEASAQRLVFVNGHYAAGLSTCIHPPTGLTITPLAHAWESHAALLDVHLARYGDYRSDFFSAQNTLHLTDGALITIAAEHNIAAPVHLLFIATKQATASVMYPRCLIVVERGSRCALIEDYVCLTEDVYLTNAVTEIVLAENAQLSHTKLQREGRTSFHIAQCAVTLARESVYTSTTASFGARLSRHNLTVRQTAEATQCSLDGLALISGRQLADTHTIMDHAHPYGRSTQLHKCIADDAAHAVFNGKVLVRSGAQLTDSRQSSRNLLLSAKAHVDTKPQLEIFADDVKCAHGATVGQLDADELFYLKSRGLDEHAARKLLIYAFAAEIIEKIPVASVKGHLRQIVLEKTQA
jgi:Fe-S cluster assembly protein SufD